MSIRSNSRPVGWDLHPEFQDVLRRNGMQAHIIREGEGYKLFVQGHDSPMLSYSLDANQIKKLTDWGTNYANKSAYNTFVDLVEKDFYLPRNFVHARNANGRVAMGLHGYRIGVGEYGRVSDFRRYPLRHFFGPSFLGWTPRNQDGFHMRRIGPAMFLQPGAPIVPERPDGRMKPGELQNGGYGFYYKGQQQIQQEPPKEDVLKELSSVIKPIPPEPRHEGAALPYKEAVTSPVYFSNDNLQQCLVTHGVIVNEEKKTLTVQSSSSEMDFIYDLSDEELKSLTSNSLKESPLDRRIDLLNDIISKDFREPITMDMLNSTKALSLEVRASVVQDLEYRSELLKGKQEAINVPEPPKMVPVPYDELIESKRKFDGEKLEQCLYSHGIEVDKENNRLLINSSESDKTHVYALTAGEVRDLFNDSLKEVPLEKRLDMLNSKISFDFNDAITKDVLNSRDPLAIRTRESVEQERTHGNIRPDVLGNEQSKEYKTENETAIPFRYVSNGPGQFTHERFEQCLKSHGIVIDSASSTLTVRASGSDIQMTYPLRKEELGKLQSDSLKLPTVESRLNLINMITSKDFRDPITLEGLNSSEPITIRLKPSVEERIKYNSLLDAGFYVKPPVDSDKGKEAIPYDDLIKSQKKFSGERFEKCLLTHGIEIDKEANKLIVNSSEANRKYDYHLSPKEIDSLLSDSLEKSPLDRRLDLLNITLARDFYTPVTMESLNSKETLSIRLRSDVENERGWKNQEEQGQNGIKETVAVRSTDRPIAYTELISSSEQFTHKKFDLCLESHGIVVDAASSSVTVQSANSDKAMTYHLPPEQMKLLQSDSLKEVSLDDRLQLLNQTIGKDFYPEISIDTLNSKDLFSAQTRTTLFKADELQINASETVAFHMNGNVLSELNKKKAWYREGGEGEQVQVDDIMVSKDSEGKYKMTAVINGESITHEISQKQFEKFSAIDEYHRLKLFSKIFDEVDMKTMPGKGINLLAAVSAGLAVARDLASGPKYGPAIYEECYSRPHVYFKPGVDSPQDLASRAFEAGVNAGIHGVGMSR